MQEENGRKPLKNKEIFDVYERNESFSELLIRARARIYIFFTIFLSLLTLKIKIKRKRKMRGKRTVVWKKSQPPKMKDIRDAIRIGDILEFKISRAAPWNEFQGIKRVNGRVKAKYPYIMEVEFPGEMISGFQRKTVMYAEVLAGEVRWKGDNHENQRNL